MGIKCCNLSFNNESITKSSRESTVKLHVQQWSGPYPAQGQLSWRAWSQNPKGDHNNDILADYNAEYYLWQDRAIYHLLLHAGVIWNTFSIRLHVLI